MSECFLNGCARVLIASLSGWLLGCSKWLIWFAKSLLGVCGLPECCRSLGLCERFLSGCYGILGGC